MLLNNVAKQWQHTGILCRGGIIAVMSPNPICVPPSVLTIMRGKTSRDWCLQHHQWPECSLVLGQIGYLGIRISLWRIQKYLEIWVRFLAFGEYFHGHSRISIWTLFGKYFVNIWRIIGEYLVNALLIRVKVWKVQIFC